MSFVYPAFLWALTALSIPLIIHLFNFRRYKTIYFPNISYLKEVKQETDSRSKLKHLLILLARLIAISFLVFAFTQPFIKQNNNIQKAGKKAVSIYLDNSFSMQSTQGNTPLLELARTKAYEILNAYEPDDEFQVLSNEFEGKQQHLVNREQAKDLIDEIKPTAQVRMIDDVMQHQSDVLNESGLATKNLYVISDFQKSSSNLQGVKPDSTINYSYVPLQTNNPSNVSIDSCWFQKPVQLLSQPQKIFVRVRNYGSEEIKEGRIQLEIDKQVKGIANFDIEPNGTSIDTLTFTPQKPGWNSCIISTTDFPVTYDDKYYFTFKTIDKVTVLQIFNKQPNFFIEALMKNNSNFSYTSANINQVPYNDLKNYMMVVLNEAPDISSGLSQALNQYVKDGGNILIVPNAEINIESYNSFLLNLSGDKIIQWNNSEWRIDKINLAQGLFNDVFEAPPENVKLPQGKGFFSFSGFTSSNSENILELNNKQGLITKTRTGRGAIFLSAVPFNKELNDLMLSFIFPPMIFKMAINKSYNDAISYSIGNDNIINLPFATGNAESLIKMKNNVTEFIPSQRVIGNNTIINTGKELMKEGIYSYSINKDTLNYKTAFNFNRKESDLACWNKAEMEQYSSSKKIKLYNNQLEDLSQVIPTDNLGFPLWKYCIAIVLIFMALEILLLKYWK